MERWTRNRGDVAKGQCLDRAANVSDLDVQAAGGLATPCKNVSGLQIRMNARQRMQELQARSHVQHEATEGGRVQGRLPDEGC